MQLLADLVNTSDRRSFRRDGAWHQPGDHLTTPVELSGWLEAHGLALAGPARTDDVARAVGLRDALREAVEAPGSTALAAYPLHLTSDDSSGLHFVARTGSPWADAVVETVAASVARGQWAR